MVIFMLCEFYQNWKKKKLFHADSWLVFLNLRCLHKTTVSASIPVFM